MLQPLKIERNGKKWYALKILWETTYHMQILEWLEGKHMYMMTGERGFKVGKMETPIVVCKKRSKTEQHTMSKCSSKECTSIQIVKLQNSAETSDMPSNGNPTLSYLLVIFTM